MDPIKKYGFHKPNEPSIELEINRIEDFMNEHGHRAQKPHKLDFYQILFVTKGNGFHTIDFEKFPYTDGTVIPVAVNQVQLFEVNTNTTGFGILFTPRFLMTDSNSYKFYSEFLIFNSLIPPIPIKGSKEKTKELFELIKRMEKDYISGTDFAKEELLRSHLKLLLLNAEQIKFDSKFLLFRQFRDKIEKDLNHTLGVNEFSKKLAVSSKTLNNVVKHCTGQTAKQVIDERLVLEIKRLLSYSELSAKEIGYQLGFDEPTNMGKYFKKHTGTTPAIFRKKFSPN